MAKHKLDALIFAEVGQLIPAKNAFAGNDEPVSVGSNGPQKGLRSGLYILVELDYSSLIDYAQMHCTRVQIDAAEVLVLLLRFDKISWVTSWGLLRESEAYERLQEVAVNNIKPMQWTGLRPAADRQAVMPQDSARELI